MFNLLTIATAASTSPATTTQQSSGGGLITFVPMILIFVVMFYFMFRSQKKQAKKRQEMIDQVVKGSDVIIAGGVHGTIVEVKDKTFMVEIADKVNVEVTKAGINGVVGDQAPASCCK
jgi:preprotein translocase subunit YajC